ncbi:MAG TPA: polysaccharide biosynthesis/export family protein [Caulobacteraceae bacterium]|jgi:polysaccharide export outer membrane protein
MSALKPAALVALTALWGASQAFGQAPAPASAPPPAPVSGAPATSLPSATAPVSPADVGPAVSRSDYQIGQYDVLDVNVFEIEDLHRQVQVDGSGHIVLPLVGEVQAQGRTPAQLADDLKVKLESRYVNNARVEIQVRQSQSEHVTVDGAVTEPGVFPLKGPTTLMQAVAMAKGPDGANANVHKVSLFRSSASGWTRTEYDLAKIRSGKIDDPVIAPRDVVVVAGSHKQEILRDLGNILPLALLMTAL